MAPDNESAVRGLMRIYQAQSPDKARAYLNGLPPRQQAMFASLRRSLELEQLRSEADAAVQRQDWAAASPALKRAVELAPDEPWLVYQLAGSLRQQGRIGEADAAFAKLLQRHPTDPQARYAHGLFPSPLTVMPWHWIALPVSPKVHGPTTCMPLKSARGAVSLWLKRDSCATRGAKPRQAHCSRPGLPAAKATPMTY